MTLDYIYSRANGKIRYMHDVRTLLEEYDIKFQEILGTLKKPESPVPKNAFRWPLNVNPAEVAPLNPFQMRFAPGVPLTTEPFFIRTWDEWEANPHVLDHTMEDLEQAMQTLRGYGHVWAPRKPQDETDWETMQHGERRKKMYKRYIDELDASITTALGL